MVNARNEIINNLHKYYIWANRLRAHFDETIARHVMGALPEKQFQIEADMYMSLWYGALYTVIEGWVELRLQDDKINTLLQSSYVGLLKRYRNGVFHFQKSDNDQRFNDFFEQDSSAVWARSLNTEYGRWFVEWYKQHSV